MKVLGLETSSMRGSVALWDGREIVAHRQHTDANRHAERMLDLVERCLADVGWHRRKLDRVAAGIGPGGFTGVRVGLSLVTGLAIGLGVPAVGVGSLAAVAGGHAPDDPRLRLVVRDARRQEFFVAAYEADGTEVLAPRTIPQDSATGHLLALTRGREVVLLGPELGPWPSELSQTTEEPDARVVARLAAQLDPAQHPPVPRYIRGAGAQRPALPPSPLASPRSR